MTFQYTVLFHSAFYTVISCAGPKSLLVGYEQCASHLSCALSLPWQVYEVNVLSNISLLLFFLMWIYIYQNIYKYIKLNIYIYIKARENKSIKQILDLEWKVLNLILSSLKKLFQLKLGRELLSLVQPHARGGCWCTLIPALSCQ